MEAISVSTLSQSGGEKLVGFAALQMSRKLFYFSSVIVLKSKLNMRSNNYDI